MIPNSQILACLIMLAICLPKYLALGQELPVANSRELQPVDENSCVFAGDEARFRYFGVAGSVEWALVAANRTISQGTGEASAAGPNEAPQLVIRALLPRLNAGVVLPAELRLTWIEAGRMQQHSRPVTVFSRDPFSVRQASLERAKIGLFDSEGETAETFEQHDIPHSRLLNLSAIDLVDEGVVIVGEGVSFRENRNLPETLLRAAERGVSVLCLAPVDGEFAFPQPDEASSGPLRIALEQSDIVRRYDKRFDLLPTIGRLAVESRRSSVVVRAIESGAGWSWLSVHYPGHAPGKSPRKLIVCGVSVIRDWKTTPVPRYLLVHLLEELTARKLAEEREKDELTQR